MLVDTHCHLDFYPAERRAELVANAKDAGVGYILNVGARLETLDEVIAIANGFENVFAAIGQHPEEANGEQITADGLIALSKKSPKIIAIGEAGLDYHYDGFDRVRQEKLLREHITAARATGLPVLIHNRDSSDDMVRIVADEMKKGAFNMVLHCFTGDAKFGEAMMEMGAYISASGIITFPKSAELREAFRTVPLERLLVETDAPFLAPKSHRGKENQSAFVAETARTLADIKGVSFEEISKITTDNFRKLFRI